MKKITTFCIALLMLSTVLSQAPQKFSYQAIVRNNSNTLVVNQAVGIKVSILQGSTNGTVVYSETQTPTSNANGLVSLEIGAGSVLSGDFSTIDWANGLYFIKTETDPNGGTNYTITGTSQLLSVPYSMHANTASSITGTLPETDPVYVASVASGITSVDTANWNNKLDSYTETDPIFGASVANNITSADTANWNNKIASELDPRLPIGTQNGEMLYWNGNDWSVVTSGNEGDILVMKNGIPTWSEAVYKKRLKVTVSVDLNVNYGSVFGQTAPFNAKASFIIDTTGNTIVMPGSAWGGGTLYGYNASAFTMNDIHVGNTTFTESNINPRVPASGYSADIWFDQPLQAGANPKVWMFLNNSDGDLGFGGGMCSPCALYDGSSAMSMGPFGGSASTTGNLTVTISEVFILEE